MGKMYTEQKRLQMHLARARKKGVSSDLCLEDWLKTLAYFNYKCAYNNNHPYEDLDHFIPLCNYGGTTVTNCVPCCKECNYRKLGKHPHLLLSVIDIEDIEGYLKSRIATKRFLYISAKYEYCHWIPNTHVRFRQLVEKERYEVHIGRNRYEEPLSIEFIQVLTALGVPIL